ncbi:MAG: hypothetical protein RJB39_754 [Candidatus Parcubacteria bacterium]
MYKDLFDEKHRLIESDINLKGKPLQSGKHEPNLLCENCDNKIIGKLETYAAKVINGGPISVAIRRVQTVDGYYKQVGGIDYTTFKLFLLSILWRASVSKQPFFSKVALGPYEETVRKMLLSSNPGPAEQFPCVIMDYRSKELLKGVVSAPTKSRLGDRTSYRFIISGLLYTFIVTEKDSPQWVYNWAINTNGEFRIIEATKSEGTQLLGGIFNIDASQLP